MPDYLKDDFAIMLSANEFTKGGLNKINNIRPNKTFTADAGIILYKIATVKIEKFNEIIDVIVKIFKS